MFATVINNRYRRGGSYLRLPHSRIDQNFNLLLIRAMASGFVPAMRRTGLVLIATVVVFSALAAANAVPVGELSVGEIEEELQVMSCL